MKDESQMADLINMLRSAGIEYRESGWGIIDTDIRGFLIDTEECKFEFDEVGNLNRFWAAHNWDKKC